MSKKVDELESLKELEKEVLSHFEDEHTAKVSRFFVNLSPSNEKMWTWRIEVEDETKKSLPPIVLIHGMAGASGIFIFNIFALAQERTVFVVDLLGFGLSDRVKLGKTVAAVEDKWVESIDQWRENVGIKRMILLGHSMGGYVTGAYLLKYPHRLERVFFADPWGFGVYNEADFAAKRAERMASLPVWKRAMFGVIFAIGNKMNPLSLFRGLGRYGIPMMKRARPELLERMGDALFDYVGACNKRNPTGEAAFNVLHRKYGFAHEPMARVRKRFKFEAVQPVDFSD